MAKKRPKAAPSGGKSPRKGPPKKRAKRRAAAIAAKHVATIKRNGSSFVVVFSVSATKFKKNDVTISDVTTGWDVAVHRVMTEERALIVKVKPPRNLTRGDFVDDPADLTFTVNSGTGGPSGDVSISAFVTDEDP